MNPKENPTEEKKKTGTLFIVSTPIGNDDDITLRAIKVMKSSDIVVCEEAKAGARTLHKYNLSQKMELLNEQNEFQKTQEMIKLLLDGKNLSLISDCGTPVFADPGLQLVRAAIVNDIKVVVVPGVTSIMTALVRSGFSIEQFLYAGFLSRKKEERVLQLRMLSQESRTVVLLETPYRLMPLLEEASKIMPARKAYIGCNLTMHFETHHYGTFLEIFHKFKEFRFKGEFVVCIDEAPLGERQPTGKKEYSGAYPRKPGPRGRYEPNYKSDKFGDRDKRDRYSDRGKPDKYGNKGKSDRYGDKGKSDKYGDKGKSDRYGDKGKSDKYGDKGKSDRYGDKDKSERTGERRKSTRYGDKSKSGKFTGRGKSEKFGPKRRTNK